jgi:hypothetical protein
MFDHGWAALHEAYTVSGENTALMQLVSDDRYISNPLVTPSRILAFVVKSACDAF